MWRETHDIRAFLATGSVDAAIATVAEEQDGVISVGQLHALGLERGAIAHRVRCKRLHRVHRGVYAVGHRALSWKGRLWAAVLAVDHSALGYHTASSQHGLNTGGGSRIELLTTTGAGRRTS